jgi:hypothetical protein
MKRILILILGLASLLGAASLAFTSCVEDPFLTPHQSGNEHHSRQDPGDNTKPDQGKDDKKDDKQDQTESNFPGSDKYSDKVKARYFGNKYSNDTDDYVLYFYLGEYDADGNFVDVGTEAAFDMLCPVTDGMKLSAGTYNCTSNDVSPYHFLDGVEEGDNVYPSFFYRQYSSERSGIDLITDGSVKVSGSGDNYSLEATFTAGTNTYKWRYTGPIEFIDETSGSGDDSGDDVPKDVKIEKFSRASVENLGAIWTDASDQTIPVDDWVVTLYGENYSTDKEYVMIELLSEQNAKSLPTGKFDEFINVSSASASAFKSGRIISGYADENSTAHGTWYCKGGTAYYAALQGSLKIEEKDGVYTVDFAFTDTDETYGGSFSGKYSGKLETVQSTSSSAPYASAPAFRSSLATRSQSGITRNSAGSRRPMRNASAARSAAQATR